MQDKRELQKNPKTPDHTVNPIRLESLPLDYFSQDSEAILIQVGQLRTICKSFVTFVHKFLDSKVEKKISEIPAHNADLDFVPFLEMCSRKISARKSAHDMSVREEIIDKIEALATELKAMTKKSKSLDLAREKVRNMRNKLSNTFATTTNTESVEFQYLSAYRNLIELEEGYMTNLYSVVNVKSKIIEIIKKYFVLSKDFYSSTAALLESNLENMDNLAGIHETLMLGTSLTELSKATGNCLSPMIISYCDILERSGAIKEEGIFRLSGSQNKMKYYQVLMEYKRLDSVPPNFDCHAFASCFKRHIMKIPEGLIDNSHMAQYKEIMRMSENIAKVNALKEIIHKLDTTVRVNLEYVIGFLVKVKSHSDKNLMNSSNLSIIFGPNLLRVEDSNKDNISCIFSSSLICSAITQLLIDNFNSFFPNSVASCDKVFRRGTRKESSARAFFGLKRATTRTTAVFGECIQSYSLRIKSKIVPLIRICMSFIGEIPEDFVQKFEEAQVGKEGKIENFVKFLRTCSDNTEIDRSVEWTVSLIVLKKYLSMMPNALCDSRLYFNWISLVANPKIDCQEQIRSVYSFVNLIPVINQMNLKFIFDCCRDIIKRYSDSEALLDFLSAQLGPVIFRIDIVDDRSEDEINGSISLFRLMVSSLEENSKLFVSEDKDQSVRSNISLIEMDE